MFPILKFGVQQVQKLVLALQIEYKLTNKLIYLNILTIQTC